jgi:hypothetical protein
MQTFEEWIKEKDPELYEGLIKKVIGKIMGVGTPPPQPQKKIYRLQRRTDQPAEPRAEVAPGEVQWVGSHRSPK